MAEISTAVHLVFQYVNHPSDGGSFWLISYPEIYSVDQRQVIIDVTYHSLINSIVLNLLNTLELLVAQKGIVIYLGEMIWIFFWAIQKCSTLC